MASRSKRDALYSVPREQVSEFVFDREVAKVFPDMIKRSVPGYATIVNMIGLLAGQYAQADSRCYDLGCSLGATALAMASRIEQRDCRILGIDNSESMIDAGRKLIAQANPRIPIELICQDLREIEITRTSVTALNFTLQFIPPKERLTLLRRIYSGLLAGGVLILSEKIAFANTTTMQRLATLHHAFKKANGYSELEISQKRSALENVLIPESLNTHLERLESAGFRNCTLWFQCFNFVSLVCFKA